MDKYRIANGVSLDEGNKQALGGPVPGDRRSGGHLWGEGGTWDQKAGQEQVEGRGASQAKEAQWEGSRAGEMLFVAEMW